ncbi:hypothetical protein ACETKC_07635 [Brevundimonas intermedia]|nr:hypothetical protein [Brevundimonas intermedia]
MAGIRTATRTWGLPTLDPNLMKRVEPLHAEKALAVPAERYGKGGGEDED